MPLLVKGRDTYAEAQRILRLAKLLKPEPQPERWHVAIQGSCVKFKRTGGDLVEPPDRRGTAIGPFSRASRLRLLSYMNKIDWSITPEPCFVTLTYPDTVIHRDYSRRSLDRFLFLRYLEKHRKAKTPSIWRVEWKPRKTGELVGKLMPHWHLLLPTVTALNENVVREMWRRSIEHDLSYLDVDVRIVKGELGAVKYLAKYVSKNLALGIYAYRNSGFRFGRHWGVTRKALIAMQRIVLDRYLTDDETDAVIQYAALTWPNQGTESPHGYTLLNPELARAWAEFLE